VQPARMPGAGAVHLNGLWRVDAARASERCNRSFGRANQRSLSAMR